MKMVRRQPHISVVILCYRAEDFVPVFVSQMEKALTERGLDYELVLVGNYLPSMRETDRTPRIVRALAERNPRIVAVVKEKRGMMGWDMRSGLDAASGDTIAVIDGDGQMPPEDVIKVYDTLLSGGFDIAKTYRKERYDGFKRVLISRLYNAALKTLFPQVRVRDANSKPKIFKREALSALVLRSDDWFTDAEIIISASYQGMRIGETPTLFRANEKRASFVNLLTIAEFLMNLFVYRIRMWFSHHPGMQSPDSTEIRA